MKRHSLLCAIWLFSLVASASCGTSNPLNNEEPTPVVPTPETPSEDPIEDQVVTNYTNSEKMSLGYHNPVSDYMFFADPTAVEYEGRLYVYGTNDSQQLQDGTPGADNTYEKIHSFQVVSTEDMVNWTYHGTIDVKEIASGGRGVSWAPSIVSRKEADGLTHFYMFYSSSGAGVGLLTATHPLGPWTAPLGANDFIDYNNAAIGDCPNPFDPGAMIDDNGTAWLAFGGGVASTGSDYMPASSRICRLSADMLSVDGDIQPIPAPYFFEASELYYIGGHWIYLYNTSWKDRAEWPLSYVDAPSACSMVYMSTDTPLVPESWHYRDVVLRNPGHQGMEYGNNHTHLHKFKGQYYMLYHTQHYPKSVGVTGGYRSICVDPIDVNESTGEISRCTMTHLGVKQLASVDGFAAQPASQAAATYGITYESGSNAGEMIVHASGAGQVFRVNNVSAAAASSLRVRVKGQGSIYLRQSTPDGKLLGRVKFDASDWTDCTIALKSMPTDATDLCFSFGPGDFLFKEWQFAK